LDLYNAGSPKYTQAQRDRVLELAGTGLSETAIADAIGASRGTLWTYFADEMLVGRARKRAAVLEMLDKAAQVGKVSAMIALCRIYDRAEKRPRERGER